MAATTFVGQNYGAGNLKRVKNGMWVTLGNNLFTLILGSVVAFIVAILAIKFFINSESYALFPLSGSDFYFQIR